jgi:tripartite-type tricarboxylate transporter receptor subunit TctC
VRIRSVLDFRAIEAAISDDRAAADAEPQMTNRRQFLTALSALTAFAAAARPATALDWPTKPVRIIVPFSPGGNTDGIARLIGQRLAEIFGQQFVVENRAGANGTIAAETVAHAAPDGYTLFMAALPQIAVFPAMTRTSYDPVKDFAPISNIGVNPFVLMVHPSFPVATVGDLIARARAEPNMIAYGSGGHGSLSHLTMALFLKRAGIEMNHVPYKGGAPAMADTVAGHVPSYFGNLSEALPFATNGKIRMLGISSTRRAPQLPQVPTIAESGYPGFNVLTWNGLLAPAATPKEVVERIARECAAITRDPIMVQRFAGYGIDPLGDGPEEFAATIAADIPAWADAVRIAGVALQ